MSSSGSAVFTTNPTNGTTCLGSPAVFTCGINETSVTPIGWLINGLTSSQSTGSGQQSTLTVSGTSQLNGASVQCYYFSSGLLTILFSPPAYLSVQGLQLRVSIHFIVFHTFHQLLLLLPLTLPIPQLMPPPLY